MKKSEWNFTTGSIPKQLCLFTFPLFCSNLLQALYSLTDMLVIGYFTGSSGLVAISNASMLCFIINSIGIGLSIGGRVVAAEAYGKGARTEINKIIISQFFIMMWISIPISLGTWLFNREIFWIMDIPAEALSSAGKYMDITAIGVFFSFSCNAVCGLLRGIGDSRHPLFFIMIASIINILLDLLLVGFYNLGTSGAAWATVIAQGGALTAGVVYLMKGDFSLKKTRCSDLHLLWRQIFDILRTGIPCAFQMIVVNLAFLLVTGIFNRYGISAAAAAGVGLKVSTLAGMPCWAIGQAVTAMSAQNMGAGKRDRVAEVARTGIRLGILVTGLTVLIVQIFPHQIIRCFNTSPEVIQLGILYLRIFSSFSAFAYTVMYICDCFAAGTGAPSLALFNSLLEAVFLRLALCWIFESVLNYGFAGVCLGMALSTLPPAMIGLAYLHWGRWRKGGSKD